MCPESGGGTPRPELLMEKTLGITSELDFIPSQECREDDQGSVLFINTEKKKKTALEATHGLWSNRTVGLLGFVKESEIVWMQCVDTYKS